jgi:antitoxin YefM
MKYLNITEARQQLLGIPNHLKRGPVIVTRRGKPVMAALDFEFFESLMETLEILQDKEFMANLRKSIRQAKRGETITLEEARNRSG